MRARFAVLVRDSLCGVHPIRYFNTYSSLTEYLDKLDACNRSGGDVKYNWMAYRYDAKLKKLCLYGRVLIMTSFFEFTAAIRDLVPDMTVSKRVFLAKHMADLMNMGHTNISRDGMQSIMYWLKVTHEISEYQYIRINDLILECEKLREVKQ